MLSAEATSYNNSVSESENDVEFGVAKPDGQNRIDKPYLIVKHELTDSFLDKVVAT